MYVIHSCICDLCMYLFACHDFVLVFFLPKFTNLHEHTHTRVFVTHTIIQRQSTWKQKLLLLLLLVRGAQCADYALQLWPLQPQQQPQLAFNIFPTLMKRNEQIFLRTFAALAPLSSTCCLCATRLVARRFFSLLFQLILLVLLLVYCFRFFRCSLAQQLIKLFHVHFFPGA